MKVTLFNGVFHDYHGISLHDCNVTSLSYDGGLKLTFADGVYDRNYNSKTGKATLYIPVQSNEHVDIKKIRHNHALHHYFGIVSYMTISDVQKYISHGYTIQLLDEFYDEICLLKLYMVNISRKKRFDVLFEWPFYGDIVLDYNQRS